MTASSQDRTGALQGSRIGIGSLYKKQNVCSTWFCDVRLVIASYKKIERTLKRRFGRKQEYQIQLL